MEELEELKARLEKERPRMWHTLPDIGLYMDQLLSCMPQQLIQYGDGDRLTSAMVNNYIKDGLVPRADGKRYSRVHLAYLTAICALKKVLSVRDTSALIHLGLKDYDPKLAYIQFRKTMNRALTSTADALEDKTEDDLPELALQLALNSYANQLACERVLDIMAQQAAARQGEPTAEKPEKAEKPKEKKK